MIYLQLEKVRIRYEKMTFHCQKDWINITTSIYNSEVSAAVSSAQQYYSEHVSHHYYVDVLSVNLS